MIDATDAASQIAQLSARILPRCAGKQLILVFNKADLVEETSSIPLNISSIAPLDFAGDHPLATSDRVQSISISAKSREHIDELQQMLVSAAHLPAISGSDVIVTNIRHYEALSRALEAIHRVQQGLASNLSGDFLSQDIRECIFHLSDIAGEVTNDMVLQNIFEHFCIGK